MKKRVVLVLSGCLTLSIILIIFIFLEKAFNLWDSVRSQKIEQIEITLEKCDELSFTALLFILYP